MNRVLEQMRSPAQRGQSVLTLECGHLWSWAQPGPPPAGIDCIHCRDGSPPLVSSRTMDLIREHFERLGRPAVLPDDLGLLREMTFHGAR